MRECTSLIPHLVIDEMNGQLCKEVTESKIKIAVDSLNGLFLSKLLGDY